MKKYALIVLCLCMSVVALAEKIEIAATQTETGCMLDVTLSADQNYSGFQMDMVIDGAYTYSDATLASPYASFKLESQQLSSGNVRFVAYSDGKSTFASGTKSLFSINLQGSGDAEFKMKNVRFTKSDGTEVVMPNVSVRFTIAPPPTYTLTFILDGEVFSMSELFEGDPVEAPDVPQKEGYTFSGWGEVPETMPAHDVTVNGSYNVNYYQLTITINGEAYSQEMVAYGTEIVLPTPPELEGRAFSYWKYTGADEGTTTMPAGNVTIDAVYDVLEFKVKYYIDGVFDSEKTYYYGETIAEYIPAEREGYTFSGWGEVPETMPAHDVELFGTYDVNYYTLTFILDGEEFSSTQVAYGSEITPPEVPEIEGLTFSGWEDVPETMPAHDVTITGSYSIAEGIGNVRNAETDAIVSWYTISGIRLNAKSASHGIYIKNGKKIVIGK